MNIDNILVAAEHLAGFLVVIFALAVLWGLTSLMSRLVRRFEGSGVSAGPATSAPVTSTEPATDPAMDDEALVVIATVVTMLLGPHSRVVAVHRASTAWADHGRRDIHLSHRLR
jgi:Na+-transporting methylmalonyl-CoA/oxaloacetate decarboxylase gamma subunit